VIELEMIGVLTHGQACHGLASPTIYGDVNAADALYVAVMFPIFLYRNQSSPLRTRLPFLLISKQTIECGQMTYKSELAPLYVSLAIGRNSRSNSGRLGYPLHVAAFSSFLFCFIIHFHSIHV